MAAAKELGCPLWSQLACVQRSKASGDRVEVVRVGRDDAAVCVHSGHLSRWVALERVHSLSLHLIMTTPSGSGPLCCTYLSVITWIMGH